MEIERKFTVKKIPENLSDYECLEISQGYLCTNPVIRVRKENNSFYMTYKGKGFLEREEYNLPLNSESFNTLIRKCDGNIIEKKRYLIRDTRNDCGVNKELTIELDIFMGVHSPLVIAEVEFETVEDANSYIPPEWFDVDVTEKPEYTNAYLSRSI